MFPDSERKMNSEYGRTLIFCLSKSFFFDKKCHFCSRPSCALEKQDLLGSVIK